MRHRTTQLATAALAVTAACGAEGERWSAPTGPIVEVQAWVAADRSLDPFAAETTDPDCLLPGFHVDGPSERAVLEVDTDECSAVTVTQPLLHNLPAGYATDVSVAHLVLFAPRPSEAVMAVAIGEQALWRARRPIPGPSGVVIDAFVVPDDVPAGTSIFFHVRNHGANAYYLQQLGPLPRDG